MKYERYNFADGSGYKAEDGKDGITGDDMRVLKRVVKGSQKTEVKVKRLETVSIELVREDGWEQMDVAVIVEEQSEYERLHEAIATLPLEQQDLIRKIHFEDVSIRAYALSLGLSDFTIRHRLKKIYADLRKALD